MRMSDDGWRERLKDALKASGKSMREVSLAAGAGAGYLHGVLEVGKDPTVEKLLAVCQAIPVSALYVLYGVNAQPGDIAILRALQDRPETRQGIMALLGARQD